MKKERITTISLEEVKKRTGKTRKDAQPGPPLPNDFWKHAKVVYPEAPKEQITVRLDADILEWFKTQGRGYQTRMNAVLRSYVDAHKNEPTVKR
ncbi:MAG: BrnA antitoxin family protein [Nitrospirales bacterium]|nr:BrnA antitoxin family protein [Nitrospirales bacterium]